MSMKRSIFIVLTIVLCCFLLSCQKKEEEIVVPEEKVEYAAVQVSTLNSQQKNIGSKVDAIDVVTDRTEDDDYDEEKPFSNKPYRIELSDENSVCKDDSGVVASSGVFSVSGNIILVQKIGTYVVSGKLTRGRIILNCEDRIQFILSGVEITSDNGPAIETYGSGKKTLTIASGTQNSLSLDDNNDAEAVIMARSALLVNGRGKLILSGKKTGVLAQAIKAENTEVSITAGERAMKSTSYLSVKNATVNASAQEEVFSAVEEISAIQSVLTLNGKGTHARDILLQNVTATCTGEEGFFASRLFSARKSRLKISVRGDGIVCSGEKTDAEDGIVRLADCTTIISDGDDGIRAKYLSYSTGTLLCYGMGTQINLSVGAECSPGIKEVFLLVPIDGGKTVEVGELSLMLDRQWRTFVYAGKAGDGYLYLDREKYAVLW